LKGVENDRLAASEERSLEWPSAMASQDRAFEVGKREIGLGQNRARLETPARPRREYRV
jgi:hypothetical protein